MVGMYGLCLDSKDGMRLWLRSSVAQGTKCPRYLPTQFARAYAASVLDGCEVPLPNALR